MDKNITPANVEATENKTANALHNEAFESMGTKMGDNQFAMKLDQMMAFEDHFQSLQQRLKAIPDEHAAGLKDWIKQQAKNGEPLFMLLAEV